MQYLRLRWDFEYRSVKTDCNAYKLLAALTRTVKYYDFLSKAVRVIEYFTLNTCNLTKRYNYSEILVIAQLCFFK